MERALVVVDDTDRHRELLREAGELAGGVDADLVLLSVISREEYGEDIDTFDRISDIEQVGYGEEQVMEVVESFAEDIAGEVLGDLDVAYEAVGAVVDEDEHAPRVLEVAEEHGCDHVFITGRRRTPAGKAIFGDTAQRVILNFDGRVTVQTT